MSVPPGPALGYSPIDAGAKCNGKTDDTAAIQAWWSTLMRLGGAGALPPGTCIVRSPLVWDMSQRPDGVRIAGAGQGQSVLDLRAVRAGTPLLITGNRALFYGDFSDFTVLTDTAGAGVQLGKSDLTDAINGFTFARIEFKNVANDTATVALRINGCFNCDFQGVVANTGGGSTTGNGKGVSLQVRYAAFSRFMGSFSNAGTGVHLTGGYVFGNVFEAVDAEVVNTGISIDSPRAERNTFIGGQFVAMTGLDFKAGSANVVTNPNISPYPGGVPVAGSAGLWLQQFGAEVATPPVPPSGTALVNSTGRSVLVVVSGGAVSGMSAGASVYSLTQGTIAVRPGEAVTLVYTAAPVWDWRAMP